MNEARATPRKENIDVTTPQNRPLVFIATPCFGGLVSQHYMLSVLGLMHHAAQAGYDATLALLGHDALITRGRNTLISQFLAIPEATHILFIDADIRFDAQQVTTMLQFNEEVVAGIYPLKVINWSAQGIGRAEAGEALETAPLEYVGSLCEGTELERRGRFATGQWCGGGFMLIKRSAILKLIAAHAQHLEAQPVEDEHLFRLGDRARLVDDEAGDRRRLLVGQVQSIARLRSRIVTEPSTITEPSGCGARPGRRRRARP
jgi:hypothetical protein